MIAGVIVELIGLVGAVLLAVGILGGAAAEADDVPRDQAGRISGDW